MNTFYNEILTDHNLHPGNKHDLPDANYILEGVNPSCGDDIILKLRVEDGMVRRLCHLPGFRGYHAGSCNREKRTGG